MKADKRVISSGIRIKVEKITAVLTSENSLSFDNFVCKSAVLIIPQIKE